MELVLLAVGGLILVALGSKRPQGDRAPSPAPTPSSPAPNSKPKGAGGPGGLIGFASKLPVIGGWAAAGTAAAWAGNRLAKAITGDQGLGTFDIAEGVVTGQGVDLSKGVSVTTVAAETTAAFGLAFAGGRAAGRGVNEALGGRGDVVADHVAQSLGGVWGVFAVFDPIASTGILITHALIYAAFSTVSDVTRLAYGQRGARADYEKAWVEAEGLLRGAFPAKPAPPGGETVEGLPGARAQLNRTVPWKDGDELARWLTPIADGYMRHRNRLAFREWMTRGRGFFGLGALSDAAHADYGWIRGYFVGRRNAAGVLTDEPPARCWSDGYRIIAAKYPDGGVATVTYERVATYRWRLVPDSEPRYDALSGWVQRSPPSWVTPAMLEQSEAQLKRDNPAWRNGGVMSQPPLELANPADSSQRIRVADFYRVTWLPVMDTVTGTRDELAEELMAVGEAVANAGAWAGWMAQPRGAFVSDAQHAEEGRKQDRFDGQVELYGDGKVGLRYRGALLDAAGSIVPTEGA